MPAAVQNVIYVYEMKVCGASSPPPPANSRTERNTHLGLHTKARKKKRKSIGFRYIGCVISLQPGKPFCCFREQRLLHGFRYFEMTPGAISAINSNRFVYQAKTKEKQWEIWYRVYDITLYFFGNERMACFTRLKSVIAAWQAVLRACIMWKRERTSGQMW